MGATILQIDAFTAVPFAGNPAAVCLLPGPGDPAWMQSVAQEMNLSETAFLYAQEDGYSLRWFTPSVEVSLCGHATLASAHALFELELLRPDEQARFSTRSGLLTAERRGTWIEMDFPSRPESPAPCPPGLADALGAAPLYCGKSRTGYLLELESEEIVRSLRPDFARLGAVDAHGIIVTSRASTEGYDFVSRFFAPAIGINEDPVTGSAHCCLGPFWGARLGRSELLARQVSSRGGTVRVRLQGERVLIGGQAVTVLQGELR